MCFPLDEHLILACEARTDLRGRAHLTCAPYTPSAHEWATLIGAQGLSVLLDPATDVPWRLRQLRDAASKMQTPDTIDTADGYPASLHAELQREEHMTGGQFSKYAEVWRAYAGLCGPDSDTDTVL